MKFAITMILGVIAFAGFGWWRLRRHAPETTTIETFITDVRAARHEAGSDPERYAYRLFHYARNFFQDKDRDIVFDQLKKQGAKIESPEDQMVDVEMPADTNLEVNGVVFVPKLAIFVRDNPPTAGRHKCGYAYFSLEVEPNRRFDNYSKSSFPPSCFLAQVLRRKSLATRALKYPNIERLSFRYEIPGLSLGIIGQTPPTEGDFSANISLFRGDEYRHDSVTLSFEATSEMEPKRRRMFSWLPIEMMSSSAKFGAIRESEIGSSSSGNFLSLEKTTVDGPAGKEPVELVNVAGIKSIDTGTESVYVRNYDLLLDPGVFSRFKKLKKLDLATASLDAPRLTKLGKLATVTELQVNVKRLGEIEPLLGLPRLTQLIVRVDEDGRKRWPDFSRSKSLKTLAIYPDPLSDGVYKSISKARGLESLTTSGAVSARACQYLSELKQLKEIDIHLAASAPTRWLADFPKMETLWIHDATIDDATMAAIARMPKLKVIYFEKVRGLNDRNIQSIANVKNLQDFSCFECAGPTPAGFIQLRGKLPPGFKGPERFPKVTE